jgi:hypothetical protein
MRTFKTFQEVWDADGSIPEDMFADIAVYFIRLSEMRKTVADPDEVTLMEAMGGDVHLLEDASEERMIETVIPHPTESRYLLLSESPSQFDIAVRVSGDEGTRLLHNTTNNSGGTSYYIPRDIARKCRNVEESVRLSNPEDE